MTEPERGSDADFCSASPAEGHFMVSRSGGQKVRWVQECSLCRWIDGVALDGWADNAIKESLTKRAQRIAVATETEPFAFVQPPSGDLDLREILTQALAASYALGHASYAPGQVDGEGQAYADTGRMSQMLNGLQAEIERIIRIERQDSVDSMEMTKNLMREMT